MSPTLKNLIFFCLIVVSFPVRATFEGDMCKMKTGATGICTTIGDCASIDEGLRKKTMSFSELVHCSFRKNEQIICCPDADRFPTQFSSTTDEELIFRKNATNRDKEQKNNSSTSKQSESDDMWKSYIESIKKANEINSTEGNKQQEYFITTSTLSPDSEDLWNNYFSSLITTTSKSISNESETIVIGKVTLDKDSEYFDLSQMLVGGTAKSGKLTAQTSQTTQATDFIVPQPPMIDSNQDHNHNVPVVDVNQWQNTANAGTSNLLPQGPTEQFQNSPLPYRNQWYSSGQPILNHNHPTSHESNYLHMSPVSNQWQNIPRKPQIENSFFPPTIIQPDGGGPPNTQGPQGTQGPQSSQGRQGGLPQPFGRWQHSPPPFIAQNHNSPRWQEINGHQHSPRRSIWPTFPSSQMDPQLLSHYQSMRGKRHLADGGRFFYRNQNSFYQSPPPLLPSSQLNANEANENSYFVQPPTSATVAADPLGPFKFRPELNSDSSIQPLETNTFPQNHDGLPNTNQSSGREEKQFSSAPKPNSFRSSPGTERPAVVACRRLQESLKPGLTQHILDGIPAELGEFPHMAAIGFPQIGNDLNYTFDCGGSLISDKFILTAAHCLLESRRQPTIIRLGKVAIHSNRFLDNVGAVDVRIKNIYTHDRYTTSETYHDIGLIELENAVNFTNFIRPVCLHTDLTELDTNVPLYVTGWGQIDANTRRVSGILLKAPLQISPLTQCNASQVYYGLNRRLVRGVIPDQLCAFDPNARKDACQGDSGGPLQLVIDQNLYSYSIVGIVSSGFGCGTTTPGLYTRVASYLDFIEKYVWPTGD